VVSLLVIKEGADEVLTATENGYGKRTSLTEYRRMGRGGQGVIAIQTEGRNGRLVSALLVKPEYHIMLISDRGTLVRTRVSEISQVGRNTQGVTLMNVQALERLVSVGCIEDIGDDGEVVSE